MARGALVVLGLALGLLIAEAWLRTFSSPNTFIAGTKGDEAWVEDPFLPFIGRPAFQSAQERPGMKTRIVKNNSFGFRTHEFPTVKRAEDFFILALGGSTTWGEFAESNETTWPAILEGLLARRYPTRHIQVFNLGVPSADTTYTIVALALVGVRLDPDLVIDYEGWNDLDSTVGWSYRTDAADHFADFDPDSIGVLQRFLPSWMLSSRVVALASYEIENWTGISNLRSYVIKSTFRWPNLKLATQRTLANFETIHSIAKGHGAETIFSTFQFFAGPTYGQVPFIFGSWTRNDAYRRFFDRNGYLYVDQDRLIPDHDRGIQVDDGHFTPTGEALVAKNYFDFIVAKGLIAETP